METIEGEVVDPAPLAVRKTTEAAVWTPSFAVGVDEAVARVNAKHDFFKRVMRAEDHYGVIPGTGTKPTLLKPGAELLLANMGLNAEFEDENSPILDMTGEDHDGEPFIAYRRRCKIYRQLGPTEHERMLVGQASGSCNSWEEKYRYRSAERTCPQCGKPAIIAGKPEFNNGVPNWVCYRKKDGCGATFAKDDDRLANVEKVKNAKVFDQENTILKMADKRALVAATLIATGCSDIFTQDIEDRGDSEPVDVPPARSAPSTAAKPASRAPEPKEQAQTPAPDPAHEALKAELWARIKKCDEDPRLDHNQRARVYFSAINKPNRNGIKSVEAMQRVLAQYDEAFKMADDVEAYAQEQLFDNPEDTPR